MKIPIDWWLRWWEPIGDWLNVDVVWRVRRIDVLIFVLGAVCVGYYWLTSGWQDALMGAAMFAFAAMLALWIL